MCVMRHGLSARRRSILVCYGAPFSCATVPSLLAREAPWTQSVRDGASFSCATAPSLLAREAPWTQSVRDGASFSGRRYLLPVCNGILLSCATTPPSHVQQRPHSVRHCASFPMRAGASFDRPRPRTPFVHDDALISCRFFPRATVPSSRILLRARQHPPFSRAMAPSLLCNGTLIQCTIGPPFSYPMTLPWFARDSVLCSPLSPTFFARHAGTVSDVVLCTEAIHPSQAEVHPIGCSIALYRVQWCFL
ncbi:hypothetical protein B0H13DRAFT_2353452 [Mycena leptocephala]|nr:hypothetical protein B0H13DRAFT_2353452 [Mycena leptocephala]